MNTPFPHAAIRPAVSSRKLVKLERTGRYEDALALIRHSWPDLSAMPEITDLEPREAAEALLRCGSLIGFLGHIKPIPNAQERSKNLLTEARSRFFDIYDLEKIADCENYLALAYWRTGEINEMEAWIAESQSRDLPKTGFQRLYSHIIKCLALLAGKDYSGIISYLAPLERDFSYSTDIGLKGDFYNHSGIAYQELGDFEEAMRCFDLAQTFHQKSGHKTYLGTVENNRAMLYRRVGKPVEAHSAIDHAIKIYRQIKDRTREGSSLDTKAQIFFTEGKYEEALQMVEKAIAMLKKTENTAYLVETYMTKVKTLVFMDNISEAAICLIDAVEIAKTITGEESARALTREFEAALKERSSIILRAGSVTPEPEEAKNEAVADGIQLVLPPSISHYTDYEGVWINGTHLENAGLAKGSLAVVVKEDVRRGDLVALVETATDLVSCGFYDADFGVVCLEGSEGSEPQLFDQNEIRILGRIVGVCNSGRDEDGKMIVEEVNI